MIGSVNVKGNDERHTDRAPLAEDSEDDEDHDKEEHDDCTLKFVRVERRGRRSDAHSRPNSGEDEQGYILLGNRRVADTKGFRPPECGIKGDVRGRNEKCTDKTPERLCTELVPT